MLIPPECQADLRNRFNPDGSNLRKLQLRLVEMLKYIDEVCQRENIIYWLAAGNILGLVRHGGFIPWDDDIDIEMKKNDFLRLREIIINDPTAPFQWQDATTDKYYYLHFAKLRDRRSEVMEENTDFYKMKGIYIDIFTVADSTRFMTYYSTKIRLKIGSIVWHFVPRKYQKIGVSLMKSFLLSFLYPLWSFINKPFRNKDKYFYYPSSVDNVFYYHTHDSIFPIQRGYFEGVEVNIPSNPEKYLKEAYGNWQVLPSIEGIHVHFDPEKVRFF